MCECENRIDKLKAFMMDFFDHYHDTIVQAMEGESNAFYDAVGEEVDQLKAQLEAI